MPLFTYTGDAGLYYPYLEGGLAPEPGSEHELEAAPVDGRWHDADGNPVVELAPEVEPVVVADAPVPDPPVDDDADPLDPPVDDEATDPIKSTRGGK